jgi:alcohol dehydrogenase class IV
MAMAALLSGIALTNAGLGAVHGFAAPIGANFPVPHGTVCAALLPHVMEANVAALRAAGGEHPALDRYAAVGRLLAAKPNLHRDEAIDSAAQCTAAFARDFAIAPLRQFGMETADIPRIVQLARQASSMRFNPVVLSDEVLGGVLLRALGAGSSDPAHLQLGQRGRAGVR